MGKKPARAKRGRAAAEGEVIFSIERRRIRDLRPNPHNTKTHPPEQVRAMAAGIKEFGLPKLSITVDEKDVLLAGHGLRLSIIEAIDELKVAGLEEVNVTVVRGWSPTRKRAFLEADNRFAELGGWDEDARRRELQFLQSEGFPVLALGWERGLDDFVEAGAAPSSFPAVGEDLETERQCPKCGFRFSGGKVPKDEKPTPARSRSTKAKGK